MRDDESGLPVSDPLTPELLEDEAVRGDFVIRWAIVLLALLLGCTEVGDTRTLVHVKTGQYLLSHGVLPPRTDVFSYTAGDRPWVNLAWLFDILLAGLYAVGGAVALTVFKALMSAATFAFLVHSGIRGVSTWWGSVCGVLALLACHAQFTALPEIVTLLGISVTLWTLSRWRDSDGARPPWGLVPFFLAWSNLDPRMFLGLGCLLLYAAGEALAARFGNPEISSSARRRGLGLVCAACTAVTLVNPFGWNALLAPIALYAHEYPALRGHYAVVAGPFESQFRPLADRAFWMMLSHGSIAWLILVAAAIVALALNHRRLSVGDGLLLFGALAAAVPAVHEIAPSALVLAVVATRNAQAWYRAGFRQSYSVDRSEVLFSRGGRVATVLGLVGLAFLAGTGRLPMPHGVRTGFGWHPSLAATLASLDRELAVLYDERPFHFTMKMGDELIWSGRKAFIDHRAAIYSSGDEDLVALHNKTRRALKRPQTGDAISGNRAEWRTTFDRHLVTAVVPDLSGGSPDYASLFDLLASAQDWQLTRLGSACAVFLRRDPKGSAAPKDAALASYLADRKPKVSKHLEGLEAHVRTHPDDIMAQAYGEAATPSDVKEAATSEAMRPWAGTSIGYEGVLLKPRAITAPGVRQALHFEMLLRQALQGKLNLDAPTAAAFAWVVIRKANEGLADDPNSAAGYRLLGTAHDFLATLESRIARDGKGAAVDNYRFYRIVGAYGQLLLLEPDDEHVHFRLSDLYAARSRFDLALHHVEEGLAALERRNAATADPEAMQQLPEHYLKRRDELRPHVQRVDEALEKAKVQERAPELQEQAAFAYSQGCVQRAIDLMELDRTNVVGSLPASFLQAVLYLEAGRPGDAEPYLDRIREEFDNAVGDRHVPAQWRFPAAMAALDGGRPRAAADHLARELRGIEFQQLELIGMTLPFTWQPQFSGSWPISQLQAASLFLGQIPHQASELRLQVALCALEAGDRARAEATLKEILEKTPDSPHRPLAVFYYAQLAPSAKEKPSTGPADSQKQPPKADPPQ